MTLQRTAFLVLLLLLILAAPRANAQLAVYGTVNLTRYGFDQDGHSDFIYRKDTAGVGGGATYLFHSESRLKAGIDLRASDSPGANGGSNGAASLRVAFVPRERRASPYFQLGGGFISLNTPGTQLQPNGLVTSNPKVTGAADFAFGLNLRATPSLDIRAIELDGIASSTTGVSSIGVGVIYNFGRL